MKIIGFIGGLSWGSTQHYYQIMNEYVYAKLGRLNSIEAVIYSINMERINSQGLEEVIRILVQIAKKLEAAGADFFLIACNTIHKVAPEVEAQVGIPLLHIIDPTAHAIKTAGFKKVGLLGTKFTLEDGFYTERLKQKHQLDVVVPEKDERIAIQTIISEELLVGKINPASRKKLLHIINHLATRGAEAIILGCTELSLLIKPQNTPARLFDTTELHAKAAVDLALAHPQIPCAR
jgi:aspartate racemase